MVLTNKGNAFSQQNHADHIQGQALSVPLFSETSHHKFLLAKTSESVACSGHRNIQLPYGMTPKIQKRPFENVFEGQRGIEWGANWDRQIRGIPQTIAYNCLFYSMFSRGNRENWETTGRVYRVSEKGLINVKGAMIQASIWGNAAV